MLKLLLAFGAVVSYRICSNLTRLLQTSHYEKVYLTKLASNSLVEFGEYQPVVQKLFSLAVVPDFAVANVFSVGYGLLGTANTSAFHNMDVPHKDIVNAMRSSFSTAKGTFRMRLYESFSPLYWFETLLYLPSRLLAYIGLSAESTASRFLQVLYWLVTPLLLLCRSNLYQHISSLFNQL